MDRVQTLIHRLQEALEQQATIAELLALSKELTITLEQKLPAAAPKAAVTVWIPGSLPRAAVANKSQVANAPVIEPTAVPAPPAPIIVPRPPAQILQPAMPAQEHQVNAPAAATPAVASGAAAKEPTAAPVVHLEPLAITPVINHTPPAEEKLQEIPSRLFENTSHINTTPLTPATPMQPNGYNTQPQEAQPAWAPAMPHAESLPSIMELVVDVPDDEIEIEAEQQAAARKAEEQAAQQAAAALATADNPATIQQPEVDNNSKGASIDVKPIVTAPAPALEEIWAKATQKTAATAPAKDLNERIAQRTTALNEVLSRRQPELAEVLAEPRVADLARAFSINEKYQFINTLFRGEEDMFERSLKTLNNFSSLPEAQYWMQRELLIKLGWNDEDELVQRFYRVEARRFS